MQATKEIIQHLSANMNLSKKDIIIGNFLGGFAWGAGTVLGAIIVASILFYTLKPLGFLNAITEPAKELSPLRQPTERLR